MDRHEHWEAIHTTKATDAVSWYEVDPALSLELIESVSPDRGSVIDVGGGQSFLVDKLLDAGFQRVAVLDIASAALEATRQRLGTCADQVEWLHADITEVSDLGKFDVWHDRAVLHFLTEEADRKAYVEMLSNTLPVGGHFVVGAFGVGGPGKCSGLTIRQYDVRIMAETLGPNFELQRWLDHSHRTPSGSDQKFFFGIFRRV